MSHPSATWRPSPPAPGAASSVRCGRPRPRYIPEILDRMSRDEVKTEHLATRVMLLDDGAEGYRMFKDKEDECVRAVFRPGA